MLNQRSWYLVYSKPRQELVAQKQLNRQGYETYLPLIRIRQRRQGRFVFSVEPLFSRYLFIRLNQVTDNWGPIRSTIGVTSIIRFSTQPTVVPDDLIKYIQANDDDNGIQKAPIKEFKHGSKVRIVDGPMYGYEGIFAGKTGQERAVVLLDIIGKATRIELPESQLELTI